MRGNGGYIHSAEHLYEQALTRNSRNAAPKRQIDYTIFAQSQQAYPTRPATPQAPGRNKLRAAGRAIPGAGARGRSFPASDNARSVL